MAEKKQTAKSQPGAPRGPGRVFIGVAATVVVAAALYSGYWNYVAAELRAGIEQWATERRADGLEVSYGALLISGFPLHLTAAMASPEMAAPKEKNPWTWKGPALVLTARPWRLTRFKVEAPGLHQLSLIGVAGTEDYFIDAVTLRAKVRYGRGAAEKIRLSVRDLVVRDGADQDIAVLEAAEVLIERPGPVVTVDAEGLLAPRALIPGLGRKTARLGFKAEATGDFPDIAQPASVNGEIMARWRDSGGTLEVRRLDLNHGPLTVSGDGTLALDKAMQPIGSFTFRVDGHMQALDRLREAGLIKAHNHGLTRLVLTALAAKQGTEGAPGLKLPLTIQDRRVFVGPVPLAALPLLRWP